MPVQYHQHKRLHAFFIQKRGILQPQAHELFLVQRNDDVGGLRRHVQLFEKIEENQQHEVGAVEVSLRRLAPQSLQDKADVLNLQAGYSADFCYVDEGRTYFVRYTGGCRASFSTSRSRIFVQHAMGLSVLNAGRSGQPKAASSM